MMLARRAILLIALIFTLVGVEAQAQDPITGRAGVIDGDTIEIQGQRIRLNGVDAPESWQGCEDREGREYRCGRVAADALEAFLAASRPTRCEFVEWDRYKRFVGNCFRNDRKSVAEWLVGNGHALDWERYSGGAYRPHQREAKRAKRGMWQGNFTEPWEARRNRRGG